MFNVYFYLVFVFAFIDWYAVWKENEKLRTLTKPITLLALILWFSVSGGWQGPTVIFGIGLIFSLAGDVFLLNRVLAVKPGFFQFGLLSFLTVQILYLIGFNSTNPGLNIWFFIILCIIGALTFFITRYLVAGLCRTPEGKKQQVPVTVYMVALSLMLFSATLTLFRSDWTLIPACLVTLGAALFCASDAILASNQFVKPFKYAEISLIVTYHLAQIAIVCGVLIWGTMVG